MDTLSDSIRASLGDAYLIERELSGGMSRVFLAEDRALSRRVVVKVLHPQLAATVSVDRFRREILTVAALQHPHIVGVLSTGNVEGLPFFVMPYVEGESLAERLHRGTISPRETVAIIKDVARALAFAHQRGIVHRDIKPGNILLAGSSAVVSDFGVAKALTSARRSTPNETAGHTTAGISLGTLLYMAPEQVAADPELDGRADLYSLGATAYEMLTGEPPFAHLPARSMLAARMSLAPPPIRTRRSDVPAALDDLLLRCLATDPADRPQTAKELIDELDAPDLLSETVSVPVQHHVQHHVQHRGRRWSILLGTAAALAICGFVVRAAHGNPGDRITPAGVASAPSVPAVAQSPSKVAIIPFVDLGSGDGGAEIAAGLTNAVAGDLSKSGSLQVVSPSAAAGVVRSLRNGSGGPAQRGADLLLEGTVQRAHGRLRVTARLSNASDGVMRWADVYDRRGSDLFDVTDDIAVAIVASVAQSKG